MSSYENSAKIEIDGKTIVIEVKNITSAFSEDKEKEEIVKIHENILGKKMGIKLGIKLGKKITKKNENVYIYEDKKINISYAFTVLLYYSSDSEGYNSKKNDSDLKKNDSDSEILIEGYKNMIELLNKNGEKYNKNLMKCYQIDKYKLNISETVPSFNNSNNNNLFESVSIKKYYIVTQEFIKGKTLDEMENEKLKKIFDNSSNKNNKNSSTNKFINYRKHNTKCLKQIIEGVSFLHENRFSHSDLKPDNIMIDNEDNVKIIDFGSVRDLKSKNLETTLQYSFLEIDEEMNIITEGDIPTLRIQNDFWAIGCIYYYMLSKENLLEIVCRRVYFASKIIDHIRRKIPGNSFGNPLTINESILKLVNNVNDSYQKTDIGNNERTLDFYLSINELIDSYETFGNIMGYKKTTELKKKMNKCLNSAKFKDTLDFVLNKNIMIHIPKNDKDDEDDEDDEYDEYFIISYKMLPDEVKLVSMLMGGGGDHTVDINQVYSLIENINTDANSMAGGSKKTYKKRGKQTKKGRKNKSKRKRKTR